MGLFVMTETFGNKLHTAGIETKGACLIKLEGDFESQLE